MPPRAQTASRLSQPKRPACIEHRPHTDVVLRPAAVAMAFLRADQAHEMIAVPGVALAAGDVLVAVELSTICGADARAAQGWHAVPSPVILGHESVGRVIAVGSAGADAADGTPLRVGDRVVWSTTVSCGVCDRCRAGLTQRCVVLSGYGQERIGPHRELTGGFASHVQLRPGTTIVRVPETLPAAALAPAACATATAWAAVARGAQGRDLQGVRVRVHGADLVGLSAVAIAESQGAIVDVVDPSAARRALGERFGAVASDLPPEIVVEASGDAAVQALDEVAVGGTVVLVGSVFPAESVPMDAESIVRRSVTIAGVHRSAGAELADAAAFLAGRGRAYPFAEAVGAVYPLTDLDAALAAASAPDAPLRIGVVSR